MLRQIAAGAAAWLTQFRQSISMRLAGLQVIAEVGTLILDASNGEQVEEVGTVVTQESWDFQSFKSAIQTDYFELEFRTGGGRPANVTSPSGAASRPEPVPSGNGVVRQSPGGSGASVAGWTKFDT